MTQMENEKFEPMDEFFNARADGYDEHMRGVVRSFEDFYSGISMPIDRTDEPINLLDLGCGTGLELQWIFERVPKARVTGIDLSEKMLFLLEKKYARFKDQLTLVRDSYLTAPLQEHGFDYAVSVMTMHHWLYDDKLALYKKIEKSLKPGGKYIEGDYVEEPELERKWLEDYRRMAAEGRIKLGEPMHYDIPFSLETQERVLREAGFDRFELLWREGSAAIYTAE